MCDFGAGRTTPRIIAPSTSYMSGVISELDTEVSGIDPTILSGLTQSMAIVIDEQIILYLGYSETNNHYLVKVGFFCACYAVIKISFSILMTVFLPVSSHWDCGYED